ncbi:hypothetical protein RDI58_009699 [Solanum bulbocastanum]|uniref:Reverse transcriptase zinc-binding domain-containing protein n=1 Tax=Solanum bulbocastanum TaxID=147425 RepID=A0AAN8YIQ2_SOLBU
MRKHWQKLGDMRSLIVIGKFHLATAYKCLWGETPKVTWRKLLCQNVAKPRQNCILWLSMHSKLRKKDRLIRWGLNVNETCVLCNTEPESLQNLFFECIFSTIRMAEMEQRNPRMKLRMVLGTTTLQR